MTVSISRGTNLGQPMGVNGDAAEHAKSMAANIAHVASLEATGAGRAIVAGASRVPSTLNTTNYRPEGDNTRAELAANIDAIQKIGDIEYTVDKVTTTQMRDGKDRRIANVTCKFCGGNTRVHQGMNDDGAWGPDIAKLLSMMGWMCRDGESSTERLWFCGGACSERYKVKMSSYGDHAVPPAGIPPRPGDVRAMYARPVGPEVTTPAAPMNLSAPVTPQVRPLTTPTR